MATEAVTQEPVEPLGALLAQLDALAELRAKATLGPWRHGPLFWEGWAQDDHGGVRVFEVPHVYPDGATQPGVYVDPEVGRTREADAAFIAAAGSFDFAVLRAALAAAARTAGPPAVLDEPTLQALLRELLQGSGEMYSFASEFIWRRTAEYAALSAGSSAALDDTEVTE